MLVIARRAVLVIARRAVLVIARRALIYERETRFRMDGRCSISLTIRAAALLAASAMMLCGCPPPAPPDPDAEPPPDAAITALVRADHRATTVVARASDITRAPAP